VAAVTRKTLIGEKNAEHRARAVHSQDTLLVQISAEDGFGWTVIAIDRKTREWTVAQRLTQNAAATADYELPHEY
jgi:hypothetical protein